MDIDRNGKKESLETRVYRKRTVSRRGHARFSASSSSGSSSSKVCRALVPFSPSQFKIKESHSFVLPRDANIIYKKLRKSGARVNLSNVNVSKIKVRGKVLGSLWGKLIGAHFLKSGKIWLFSVDDSPSHTVQITEIIDILDSDDECPPCPLPKSKNSGPSSSFPCENSPSPPSPVIIDDVINLADSAAVTECPDCAMDNPTHSASNEEPVSDHVNPSSTTVQADTSVPPSENVVNLSEGIHDVPEFPQEDITMEASEGNLPENVNGNRSPDIRLSPDVRTSENVITSSVTPSTEVPQDSDMTSTCPLKDFADILLQLSKSKKARSSRKRKVPPRSSDPPAPKRPRRSHKFSGPTSFSTASAALRPLISSALEKRFFDKESKLNWRNYSQRPLLAERIISGTAFEECGLVAFLKSIGLWHASSYFEGFYLDLVKEFYSNLHKSTRDPSSPWHFLSYIRGHFIIFSPNLINRLLKWHVSPLLASCVTHQPMALDLFVNEITGGLKSEWGTGNTFAASYLSAKYFTLFKVLTRNLLPTMNVSVVTKEAARLLFCLGRRIPYNLGFLIFCSILGHAESSGVSSTLPHPGLISDLICTQNVSISRSESSTKIISHLFHPKAIGSRVNDLLLSDPPSSTGPCSSTTPVDMSAGPPPASSSSSSYDAEILLCEQQSSALAMEISQLVARKAETDARLAFLKRLRTA